MNKDVVYINNGVVYVVYINIKKNEKAICNNIDATRDYHTK